MQLYKVYFIILLSIAISVLATFFFFDFNKGYSNSIDRVTELQAATKENKENINKIKELIDTIRSANMNNNPSIITDISLQQQNKENIKRLSRQYQSLNDSLLAQRQREEKFFINLTKDSLSSTGNQNTSESPEIMPVFPPSNEANGGDYNTQLELNWENAEGDESEYATSIQNIFSKDLSSLSANGDDLSDIVSSIECKTDICKMTIEYPDKINFSAAMTLLEKGGEILQGKTITSIPKQDNQSGMIRETVYISQRKGSNTPPPNFLPQN